MIRLLSNLRAKYFSARHYLLHIREELAFYKAKQMAESAWKKYPVRHFIVPTPEGVLRIITWEEALLMRGEGFFPRKMKLADLYKMSFYWTAASRRPIHGNSLPKRYVNKDALYKWWYMTH